MYKELPCPCLSFFLPPLTCPSVIFPHLPASSRIFPHLPSPPFFSFRPRPSALALFFLLCLVPLSISPSSLTPLHSFPPPFSFPPHCAFPFLSSFLLPLPAHSFLSLLPPPIPCSLPYCTEFSNLPLATLLAKLFQNRN